MAEELRAPYVLSSFLKLLIIQISLGRQEKAMFGRIKHNILTLFVLKMCQFYITAASNSELLVFVPNPCRFSQYQVNA